MQFRWYYVLIGSEWRLVAGTNVVQPTQLHYPCVPLRTTVLEWFDCVYPKDEYARIYYEGGQFFSF